MKFKTEAYGLRIAINNVITDALMNGKWGVKYTFISDDNKNRYEVVLDLEQSKNLIKQIEESIKSVERIDNSFLIN